MTVHLCYTNISWSQVIANVYQRKCYVTLFYPWLQKCRSNHLTKKQPIVVKTNHSKDLYQINLTSLG